MENLGLVGGGIRAISESLSVLRRDGYDCTLAQAIERGNLILENDVALSCDGLDVKTGQEAVNKIISDLGIDTAKHTMDFIIQMPDDQRWIVPEIFLAPIEEGMRQNNDFYNSVVAESVEVSGNEFTQPQIDLYGDGQNLKAGGIAATPQAGEQVTFSSRTLKGTKFERKISIPREVQQHSTLDQLQIFMSRLGKVWGNQLTRQAIDVLLTGDATNGTQAPGTIGVEVTGNKLAWIDLIRILARSGRLGFNMTTVITTEESTVRVLNMDEFKNRQDGTPIGAVNIQGNLPNSWNYFMHSVIPTGKYIFLDPQFAIRELVSEGLRVESERIMDRDLTTTYVRINHAFANIERQARVVVDESLAFSGNGWPAFMNPID